MRLIPDLLRQAAALSPTAPALRDLPTGRRLTYRAFETRVAQSAGALHALGVGAGDRVALLCRNRIEFFEILFALARLGAIGVPLNWRMPMAELEGLVALAAPRLALIGAEDAPRLPKSVAAIGFDEPSRMGWAARREGAEPFAGRRFWPSEEAWYLLFTSGTTGAPKAVIQTYGMALANYVSARQAIRLVRGQRTLNFLPLFHTAGINLFTLPYLFEGGEVALLPGFDADRTLDLLAEGIDAFFGVPAVYRELSLHPRFEDVDLTRTSYWACGGAPLPDALVKVYAARGVHVCNGYGMTETGPTTFLVDPEHALAKIGSVGMPRLLTAARIVAPDGAALGAGAMGELQIKGPGVTPGYWNAPEATRAAFADDGWLKTGDLATVDDDGFYYIVGRSKEMFISGGENVYPAEVENAYAAHPAVAEAAVIGVPDEKWGEVGRAYLLLRPGARLDTDDLVHFGRERLAAYKVPKSFVAVPEFPRTAAGKVQKHLLPRETPPTEKPLFSFTRTPTQDEFDAFAELSGDDNPIHVDPAFSAQSRFGRTVAHGMFLYAILWGALREAFPERRPRTQHLMFPNPAFAGEPLVFEGVDRGETIAVSARRAGGGDIVLEGRCDFDEGRA